MRIYTFSSLLVLLFAAMRVLAAESSVVLIESGAFNQARGTISINQAAGNGNAQINGASVALSHSGVATAENTRAQSSEIDLNESPDLAVVFINDGAFARAEGVMAINQASGEDNTQANGVAIAVGIEAETTTNGVLSRTLSNTTPAGAGTTRGFAVSVADTAFREARGIAQLNQSAGSGNNSANHFALRISGVIN